MEYSIFFFSPNDYTKSRQWIGSLLRFVAPQDFEANPAKSDFTSQAFVRVPLETVSSCSVWFIIFTVLALFGSVMLVLALFVTLVSPFFLT